MKIQLKVPDALLARIADRARHDRTSPAEVIAKALDALEAPAALESVREGHSRLHQARTAWHDHRRGAGPAGPLAER